MEDCNKKEHDKRMNKEKKGSEYSMELPIISVQGEKSPSHPPDRVKASSASKFFRKSSSNASRKLTRENAMDDNGNGDKDEDVRVNIEPGTEELDVEGDVPMVIKRRMTMPASTSDFRRTLSEEAKYVVN